MRACRCVDSDPNQDSLENTTMRLSAFISTAILATTTLLSTVVHADQLADIRKKGEIVIGVLGIDEPNSFVDPKTREFIGYEIDLAHAIAKKIGVKPVFKQVAVAARIPELQQGHVDILAASLTHNKERESQIDFSLTTFVTGSKVLVKKSSGINNVAELAGKKVVTVKGGTQEPNLRRAVPTADVVTFESTQQAFQALQQGKGVGYVNDEASLNAEPLAIGIKKGEAGVKSAIDDTLRELEKSGEAEKLFFKWYGPDTRLKFQKRNFKIDSDKVES